MATDSASTASDCLLLRPSSGPTARRIVVDPVMTFEHPYTGKYIPASLHVKQESHDR